MMKEKLTQQLTDGGLEGDGCRAGAGEFGGDGSAPLGGGPGAVGLASHLREKNVLVRMIKAIFLLTERG